jgi:hypothetical protein
MFWSTPCEILPARLPRKAGYACAHVSRTEDANGTMGVGLHRSIPVTQAEYSEEAAEQEGRAPNSAVSPGRAEATDASDASERARLITQIGRQIRGPEVPEATRLAGLTLIGWLARRRPEEAAHAVGVGEARKSERRLRAARPKAR